jgi:hypothetical protein
VLLLLIGGFGFYKVVDMISINGRMAVEAQKQSNKQVKQLVTQAKQELTSTVQAATDTITGIALDAKTSADSAARLAKKTATISVNGQRSLEQKIDHNNRVLDRVNSRSIQAPAPIPGRRKVSESELIVQPGIYVSRLDTLNYY